jgi:hypothetical protein
MATGRNSKLHTKRDSLTRVSFVYDDKQHVNVRIIQ